MVQKGGVKKRTSDIFEWIEIFTSFLLDPPPSLHYDLSLSVVLFVFLLITRSVMDTWSMLSIHFTDIIGQRIQNHFYISGRIPLFSLFLFFLWLTLFSSDASWIPLFLLFEPPPFFLTCRCILAIPYFPHFSRTCQLIVSKKKFCEFYALLESGFFQFPCCISDIIPHSISLSFTFTSIFSIMACIPLFTFTSHSYYYCYYYLEQTN